MIRGEMRERKRTVFEQMTQDVLKVKGFQFVLYIHILWQIASVSFHPQRSNRHYLLAQFEMFRSLHTEKHYLFDSLQREEANAASLARKLHRHQESQKQPLSEHDRKTLKRQIAWTNLRLDESYRQKETIIQRLQQVDFEIQKDEHDRHVDWNRREQERMLHEASLQQGMNQLQLTNPASDFQPWSPQAVSFLPCSNDYGGITWQPSFQDYTSQYFVPFYEPNFQNYSTGEDMISPHTWYPSLVSPASLDKMLVNEPEAASGSYVHPILRRHSLPEFGTHAQVVQRERWKSTYKSIGEDGLDRSGGCGSSGY